MLGSGDDPDDNAADITKSLRSTVNVGSAGVKSFISQSKLSHSLPTPSEDNNPSSASSLVGCMHPRCCPSGAMTAGLIDGCLIASPISILRSAGGICIICSCVTKMLGVVVDAEVSATMVEGIDVGSRLDKACTGGWSNTDGMGVGGRKLSSVIRGY